MGVLCQRREELTFLLNQQYFKYEFPEGMDSAIVKVTSSTAFPCSVISVQDILCPVYDLDNNVAFIGTYQTMTKKAAITVQKKDFPSHSFYVVVVVKTEDEACGGALHYYPFSKDEPVDQGNRQKTLHVVVTPAVSSEAYLDGILFCLGVFLSFYVLTVLVACWENWRRETRRQQQLCLPSAVETPSPERGVQGNPQDAPDSFLRHPPLSSQSYGSFADTESAASTENVMDSLLSTEAASGCTGEMRGPTRWSWGCFLPLGRPAACVHAWSPQEGAHGPDRPWLPSVSSWPGQACFA